MPEDIAVRICDAHWNGGKGFGITFVYIDQHNACNHTLCGKVDFNGKEYGFIVDSGDWNGFVVREFCPVDESHIWDYTPSEPTKFTFVPKNDNLKTDNPGKYQVYLKWKTQQWFKETLQHYHYDRYFQPGVATESYYKEWADKKGLKIVSE